MRGFMHFFMFMSAAACLWLTVMTMRLLRDTSPRAMAERARQARAATQSTQMSLPRASSREQAIPSSRQNAHTATIASVSKQVEILPRVELLGTFVDADPALATAMVQESDDTTIRTCRLNDIVDGWTLKEIGRGYIVLALGERTYRQELLGRTVEPERAPGLVGTIVSMVTTGTIPAKPWLAPEEVDAVKSAIQEVSPTEHVVDRSKVFDALKNQNPLRVLREAAVRPLVKGGKFTGAELTSVPSDGVLSHSGFQSGDVVQGINGQAITDPRMVFELPNQLSRSEQITVSVERNGHPVTLTYRIQ